MESSHKPHWNPAQYARNARFVSDLGVAVVELLAPRSGERVLDLGCGDGALTARLVEAGCEVVGVDSSPEMVAAARALDLDARLMAGQALGFVQEFDAVFSNAALHWMKQPGAVIDGVWRALAPGGRFVGEFGGRGNVATIVAAMECALARRRLPVSCPWFFPHPGEYQALLESRGFVVRSMDLLARPTPLPGDLGAWLETFAQHYTAALPVAERAGFIAEVVESLRPVLRDQDGRWTADYVRLRFFAMKPDDST